MTEALVETSGKYRTVAGVVLSVKDADDKLLNCRAIQAGRLPTEADTRSQYMECRVGYIPSTRKVAYLKTADGVLFASLPTTKAAADEDARPAQQDTASLLEPEPISAEEFREFIPEGMRNSHRWGVVGYNKQPYEGGAPEWRRDFEAARRWRDKLIEGGKMVHKRVLGYCFGGISNRSREAAGDPDHDNLTAEEATKQGKTVGALYMRPEPRYGCVDCDHVLDKATRELRKDLPEKLAAEITTIAAAWPTEVSASGTGLHIIFEKREGWPAFKKYMDEFPEIPRKKGDEVHREVFSGAGYVNFTGDRWKTQNEPTQEQKDAAYKLLLDIINKHGEKKDTIHTPVSPRTLTNNKPTEEFKREATSEFCPPKVSTAQFAEWKKRHNAVDICLRNGYTQEGDRLRKPNSTHGAGVQIQDGGEKVYSHHAGDPLCDEHPHDAYDCVLILECGGDHTRAGQQILQDLGLPQAASKKAGETKEGVRGISQYWQPDAAHWECEKLKGNLPDTIKDAGGGMFVVIDPKDGFTKLTSSGSDQHFRRWCNAVFPQDMGYDAIFAKCVFDEISVLQTAGTIPSIDIEKPITAIPCKEGGYISLKTGKRCERPAEMEYCPFVLNLSADEAEYDPDYKPTGRVLSDFFTYIGAASTKYLLSVTAASIPQVPANKKTIVLTGPTRSSKTTFGMTLGELGLSPPSSVDFSTEIDSKTRFRPELAENISKYPMLFINDPQQPDANIVKKFCDTTQQYERKRINQTSVYQRSTCVLTMNEPPNFKTSAMDNKIFFICSQRSYRGREIDPAEYKKIARSDGSLRDIWQAILREGLNNKWKITIPEECKMHNDRMQIGAAPTQVWLSECKRAPSETQYFKPLTDIYANYIIYTNPDADRENMQTVLEKNKKLATWRPTPQKDGFEGKTKAEINKELLAQGITPDRIHNQRGFYVYLPSITPEDGKISVITEDERKIDSAEAWDLLSY